MGKRFYIGKRDQEDVGEDFSEWLAGKIPDAPAGTICECDKERHAHESQPDERDLVLIIDCPAVATTYRWQIDGEHVCYSYVCDACMWATTSEDYAPDIPVLASGYAPSPRHCS